MYVDIAHRDKDDTDRNDLLTETPYGHKCKWLEGAVAFIAFRDMYVLFWAKYCTKTLLNLALWKYPVWSTIWATVYMLTLPHQMFLLL